MHCFLVWVGCHREGHFQVPAALTSLPRLIIFLNCELFFFFSDIALVKSILSQQQEVKLRQHGFPTVNMYTLAVSHTHETHGSDVLCDHEVINSQPWLTEVLGKPVPTRKINSSLFALSFMLGSDPFETHQSSSQSLPKCLTACWEAPGMRLLAKNNRRPFFWPKPHFSLIKPTSWGWGDSLVGKALALPVWGPKFNPPKPHKELRVVAKPNHYRSMKYIL